MNANRGLSGSSLSNILSKGMAPNSGGTSDGGGGGGSGGVVSQSAVESSSSSSGGTGEGYTWAETTEECEITIPLPEGVCTGVAHGQAHRDTHT